MGACCARFHEEQKEGMKRAVSLPPKNNCKETCELRQHYLKRRQEQNRANQRAFRARQERFVQKLKEDYAKLEEDYRKLNISYSQQAEKTFFLESKLRESARQMVCSNCAYRVSQL
jgi:hypothetical protein